MFALLSDPEFMRGSLSSCQKSIWASLDNLRIATLKQNLKQSGTEELMVDDPESIMLYGPLQPGDESEIELARSQIVSVDANGTVVKIISDSALGASSSSEAPQTSVATPKLVWLPSTTKLSLQVMWWGYRLWLPPPVMAQLNSKEADAVKVASLITTALGWLVGHVPVSLIPLPLMPAFQLVKAIVPYIGYIGGFISWSWGEILSFDKGHGVTLTSTWLLPIALIPGTW
ncbi:uncharacterized protein BXZ73DRAFT_26395, partial [Epithele typhae]|uniref:uncharacterized protein n=1 Tax=Epithele typhae TaxID=378194 RepID=UPI002007F3F2